MGVVDNVKEIASVVRTIGNLDLYRKIVDLQSEVLDLVQEKVRLTEQVTDLSEKLSIQDALDLKEEGYWRRTEGGKEDGPFCTACWDADKKLIHLVPVRGVKGCPVCGTFRTKEDERVSATAYAAIKAALCSHRKK